MARCRINALALIKTPPSHCGWRAGGVDVAYVLMAVPAQVCVIGRCAVLLEHEIRVGACVARAGRGRLRCTEHCMRFVAVGALARLVFAGLRISAMVCVRSGCGYTVAAVVGAEALLTPSAHGVSPSVVPPPCLVKGNAPPVADASSEL